MLEMNRLMGLPEDFETPALKVTAAYAVRGNGVPIHMGRALARAVINNFYKQYNKETYGKEEGREAGIL